MSKKPILEAEDPKPKELFEPEIVPPPKLKDAIKGGKTKIALGIILAILYIWSFINAWREYGKELAFTKSLGVLFFIIVCAFSAFLKKIPPAIKTRMSMYISFGILVALTSMIVAFMVIYRYYEMKIREKVKV